MEVRVFWAKKKKGSRKLAVSDSDDLAFDLLPILGLCYTAGCSMPLSILRHLLSGTDFAIILGYLYNVTYSHAR